MSFRTRTLFLAGLLAAVSCSDAGDPVGPRPRPDAGGRPTDSALQALDCSLNLASATLQCTNAQPGTGDAFGLIVGGQNLYVTLAGADIQRSGNTVSLDVTVRNLVPQTLGVDAGGAADADGVQMYFHELLDAAGSGIVQPDNADGDFASFDGQMRPFFRYEPLAPGQTSASRTWTLSHSPGVTEISMKLYVAASVQHPQGWVDIDPDAPLVDVGETATLADTVRDVVGRVVYDDVTWSSSDPAIVAVTETSDSTAQIQGVARGTAWIRAQSIANSARKDSVRVTVNDMPVLNLDSISAISNVTMPVDSAHGMLANDSDDEKLMVSAGEVATDQGGTAMLNADGSFTYLGKPGYAGLDTIRYEVSDGARTLPGKAVVMVEASRYWFVRAGATGDGRDGSPFGTLAAAQDSAVAGDTIFVLAAGAQRVDGPVTLEAGQAVIGQGIGASIGAGTYNGAPITLLAAGAAPELTNSAAGATITLGTNNVIRGVGITAANGAAIAGNGFGTLVVRETGVNPAGPAVHLSNGALDVVFTLLSSTGSATEGLYLNTITGKLTAVGGHIQNAAGTAVSINGGRGDLILPLQVTNTAGLAVSIADRVAGSVSLSGAIADSGDGIVIRGMKAGTATISGSLNLTGAGVLVRDQLGGAVTFSGSSKIINTGANAGMAVESQQGGSILISGGGLAITTTTGAGFRATHVPWLLQKGTIAVTGANNTIATGTGPALRLEYVLTAASGLSFRSVSADGAVNGIATAGVSGPGFQVTGQGAAPGSGGTIRNTTGAGIGLVGGGGSNGNSTASIAYMNVESPAGPGVSVEMHRNLTLTAVSISGAGASGNAGIYGADFGTITVAGTSVAATGGPALSLIGGPAGTVNGSFSRLSSMTSAGKGVFLRDVQGTFSVANGTISNPADTAFAVISGGVSVNYAGDIAQTVAAKPLVAVTDSYTGGHTGSLTFTSGTLHASTGTGLQFSNADGSYTFSGTTTLNGGDAGIDVENYSSGTFSFGAGASVTNAANELIRIVGSAPTFTYAGSFSRTAGNATGITAQNNTGGSITFNGDGTAADGDAAEVTKSLSTGTAAAVSLSNNVGATITFAGGGLAAATTTGTGFNATGGGTVQVTGAGNTAASSEGMAVNVVNTTLGAGGASFTRVDAGGGASGIVLRNVGTGGFQVTGDGPSSTAVTTRGRTTWRSGGGSIVPGSGGTIQNTTGKAVLLSNAGNVVLRNLTVQSSGLVGGDTARAGISAASVSGLELDNVLVSGHLGSFGLHVTGSSNLLITHSEFLNNASKPPMWSTEIWNVRLEDMSGSSVFRHSRFQNSRSMGIGWRQTGASHGAVSIENAEISGTTAGDGVGVRASNGATANLSVTGSRIRNNSSAGVRYAAADGAGGGVTVRQDTLEQNAVDVALAHEGAGRTLDYTVSQNVTRQQFTAGSSHSIHVSMGGGSSVGTVMRGSISDNVVGNAAVTNSGSDAGRGILVEAAGAGTGTVAVTGNTVRQVRQESAFHGVAAKGTSMAAGSPRLNLTVTGNDFRVNTGFGAALAGMKLTAGMISNIGDDPTLCANIHSNTAFVGHAASAGVHVATAGYTASGTSANPTIELQGYTGAADDQAQIEGFLGSSARATTNTPAAILTRTTGTVRAAAAACATP